MVLCFRGGRWNMQLFDWQRDILNSSRSSANNHRCEQPRQHQYSSRLFYFCHSQDDFDRRIDVDDYNLQCLKIRIFKWNLKNCRDGNSSNHKLDWE